MSAKTRDLGLSKHKMHLGGHPAKTLLCFEVISSTEWQPAGTSIPFEPHRYIDISTSLDQKSAALDAYSEEMRRWPHSRSIEAV